MHTSILLLAAFGVHGPLQADAVWLRDYQSAQRLARNEQKPLAVVLGSGESGWQALCREGQLGHEAQRLLAADYVCVYIDTSEASGKRLAAALDIPNGPGLVISDRSGDLQAFSHAGVIGGEDLARYLRRYAERDRLVRRTESSSDTAEPATPAVQPTAQPVPVYVPRISRSC